MTIYHCIHAGNGSGRVCCYGRLWSYSTLWHSFFTVGRLSRALPCAWFGWVNISPKKINSQHEKFIADVMNYISEMMPEVMKLCYV